MPEQPIDPYAALNSDEHDRILKEVLAAHSKESLAQLLFEHAYEDISEAFNNEVLERWEAANAPVVYHISYTVEIYGGEEYPAETRSAADDYAVERCQQLQAALEEHLPESLAEVMVEFDIEETY